jgi:hypothetical protein
MGEAWFMEGVNHVAAKDWTTWATLMQHVAIDHTNYKNDWHKLSSSPQQSKNTKSSLEFFTMVVWRLEIRRF